MPIVVLKSLSCSQHSDLLPLLLHHLSPLLKAPSEHPASPLPILDISAVFLLLKQLPCEPETDAGKPASTSVDESTRDGDHAPELAYLCSLVTRPIRLCTVAMSSPCAVSGSVTMPWQPAVTPAVPLAHARSPSSYPSPPHVSRPARCGCTYEQVNRAFLATTTWAASQR